MGPAISNSNPRSRYRTIDRGFNLSVSPGIIKPTITLFLAGEQTRDDGDYYSSNRTA
jgi:hypothetical protein